MSEFDAKKPQSSTSESVDAERLSEEDMIASSFRAQWAEAPGIQLEGLRALAMDTPDEHEVHPLTRGLERLLTSGRTVEHALTLVRAVDEIEDARDDAEAWLTKTLPADQPLGPALDDARPTRPYAVALDLLLQADVTTGDALCRLTRVAADLGDGATLDAILQAVTPTDEEGGPTPRFDDAMAALLAEGLSESEASAQVEASFAAHGTDVPIRRILSDALPNKYPLMPPPDPHAHDYDAGRQS